MRSNLTYNNLGNTEIKVSSLCFGTLTVSPLQCDFSTSDSADLFCYAIDQGINFFDTANLYGTYPPLKEAVKYKKDIVIATKDYCYDEKTAQASLERALSGIGRDYVDIFLLHEQESVHTIRGHWEAIEFLLKRKKAGDIKAIGLSTHFVSAVMAVAQYDELDIIHPIYNMRGLGIVDGSREDMLDAINLAVDKSKGIYLMKALGGGHLIPKADEAFKAAMKVDGIGSIAVGMKTQSEVDLNVSIFSKIEPTKELRQKVSTEKRKLLIHDWCTGCGSCVTSCDKGAISIIDSRATVDENKCVLCGYCAAKCKDFCIKVI